MEVGCRMLMKCEVERDEFRKALAGAGSYSTLSAKFWLGS